MKARIIEQRKYEKFKNSKVKVSLIYEERGGERVGKKERKERESEKLRKQRY